MKIRRYFGKDTQEAILKVKMDLGNDAMILNTRKVHKKGLAKVFSKPVVEVLAAIDEYRAAASNTMEKDNAPEQNKTLETDKYTVLENKINKMEEMLMAALENSPKKEGNIIKSKPENEEIENEIKKLLMGRFIKNEIEEIYANRILDEIQDKIGPDGSINEYTAELYKKIYSLVGKPDTIKLKEDEKPTVVIFVGPTGVGKTTSLAKLAANYSLNEKKNVGLITTDTYRIAAVEQLKTYAEILSLPLTVVYTEEDMKEKIKDFSDKDIVLIDTTGRSHKNKSQVEEVKSWINSSSADEIYLVLSVTTSNKICREILKAYEFLDNYKLLFTKLDEASCYGLILNAQMITGKNLSYITTGQNVPDDIEVAETEKIVKKLLGSQS